MRSFQISPPLLVRLVAVLEADIGVLEAAAPFPELSHEIFDRIESLAVTEEPQVLVTVFPGHMRRFPVLQEERELRIKGLDLIHPFLGILIADWDTFLLFGFFCAMPFGIYTVTDDTGMMT